MHVYWKTIYHKQVTGVGLLPSVSSVGYLCIALIAYSINKFITSKRGLIFGRGSLFGECKNCFWFTAIVMDFPRKEEEVKDGGRTDLPIRVAK